jgi:uncharacterized membrane protein YcjF (UPF0283 family)
MNWTADSLLTYLTIITLFAVVVGDRVLGWLRTRGVDLTKLGEIHETTQELLRRFDDGALEEAIRALSLNVAAQTAILQELVGLSKLQHQEHKLILDQLVRNGKR